jgi:hypothetical protein
MSSREVDMTLEEQDFTNRLELAKANLERTRQQIKARRAEELHKELSLSIRYAIADRATHSRIAKGYSKERLRITNDLPKRFIEIQVDRGAESRKLTLSWGTEKFVTALCERRLVGAIETDLREGQLKIVSVVTPEMFVDKCIKALGFGAAKEAA